MAEWSEKMNNDLTPDWTPGAGKIYTWYAMDKNGRIGVFVNNCWGDLPRCILLSEDASDMLINISEYLYEESQVFTSYPEDKAGGYLVDLFPAWIGPKTKEKVKESHDEAFAKNRLSSEANFAINKGVFIYFAVEGNYPGEDYPVGYDGESEMGDYYRYLVPTVYGSIDDFPDELKSGIAVSDSIDFTVDRLIPSKSINQYFKTMYGQ